MMIIAHQNVMSSSPEHTCASFTKRPSVVADSASREIFSLCIICWSSRNIARKWILHLKSSLRDSKTTLWTSTSLGWRSHLLLSPMMLRFSRDARCALSFRVTLLAFLYFSSIGSSRWGGMISTYLETGGIDPTCQTYVRVILLRIIITLWSQSYSRNTFWSQGVKFSLENMEGR